MGTTAAAPAGQNDTSGGGAAEPAIFLALLWPQLSRRRGRAVALGAVVVALPLVTVTPAGVPIIAAVAVAIVAGVVPEQAVARTEES